ncbi:ATP-binding protein [Kitasatospora sp. NPDC050543]|uniref:ATP-binding protein n=1 Tax=Kitasatospora sp. NPDC050543 TaxID=3364054 RepID=UPI0037952CB0
MLTRPPALVGEESSWLPRHRKSSGAARGRLRAFLSTIDKNERLLEVGELVISELVANAVEHARTPPGRLIEVRFEMVATDQLRIEVHDASSEHPVIRPLAGDDDESGRGLCLVEALVTAWGCCPRPGGVGKFVWALIGPVEGKS